MNPVLWAAVVIVIASALASALIWQATRLAVRRALRSGDHEQRSRARELAQLLHMKEGRT